MKKQVFIDAVLAGRPLVLVEYRATETDEINRKAPKQGESATMPIVKHTILVGNKSYEVAEFLPDKFDVKTYKATYQMRDLVVLEIDGMEKTKWGDRINGEFHGKIE